MRGHDLGAAVFARGEGIIVLDGSVYFTCTSGGVAKIGQVWRYTPGRHEGGAQEKTAPGELRLLVEPNDASLLKEPDNLTATPSGEIMLCEDPSGAMARLVVLGRDGALWTFARTRIESEFAGATFAPDGSTLFVNLQKPGLTLAIHGAWSGK
jgi:hypothetical protein